MEIHKPKAAHSWGEFLIEIGTIICGILVALALEQAVEWAHGEERLHQVQDQLHVEISTNMRSAAIWLALTPCLDQEISEIESALWAGREDGRYPGAARFSPPLVQFQSEAWLNARAMQIFDRVPTSEVRALTAYYFFPTEMQTNIVSLHSEAGELDPLSRPLDHLTPAEADDLLARLGRAKELYARMNLATVLLLQSGRDLGAKPTFDFTRAELLSAFGRSGQSCVGDPVRVWKAVKSARDEVEARAALHLRYMAQ
jgi:hypothetical protein